MSTTGAQFQERFSELTDRLLAGFRNVGTIRRPADDPFGGVCPLPDGQVVIDIARDIQDIVFPGFRRRSDRHPRSPAESLGEFIDDLHERLAEQFALALRHEAATGNRRAASGSAPSESRAADAPTRDSFSLPDFDALGRELTACFLETLPRVQRMLACDVQAAFEGDPAARSTDEVVAYYPGIEAVTVHRLAHEMHRLGVPLVPRMLAEWAHGRTGIDIHPGAKIGPSFFIDHGTGVVIGETCEIAADVKLYQGVTLGALSFPRDEEGQIIRGQKRHPTIEEGVVIYANATILGGTTVIGRNSVIGACVSLTRSVPPNTVVTIDKPQLKFRAAG